MSRRNYVEDLEYLDAKGLDTSSPISLVPAGFVREAINVNLGPTGGYIKRPGYVAEALLGLENYYITNALQYRSTNFTLIQTTVNRVVLVGQNEVDGVVGEIDTSPIPDPENLENPEGLPEFRPFKTFYKLDGGYADAPVVLGPSDRGSFSQVGTSLFYLDGSGYSQIPFVYESNIEGYVRALGIDPPTDAPVPDTSNKGTSVLYLGNYIYVYTYAFYKTAAPGKFGALVAESNPSPFVVQEILGENDDVVFFNVTPFPDYELRTAGDLQHLTVKIRVYRTVANGSILFYTGRSNDLPGDATVYEEKLTDEELQPEQLSPDNTRIYRYNGYDAARFPVVARNRLLLFHESENKGRFSKINANGPLPESFPVINEFSVEGKFGASDAIIGAGQIKDVPIILKERSVGRLDEIGIPDLGNNDDAVAYIYREISDSIGGVSNFAHCQVLEELIFLGRDNVYATNGQTIRPIATQIQNKIKEVDFSTTAVNEISMINDTKNKRIYIQVYKNTGSQHTDVTYVGDYQQYPNFRWTTYEPGVNPVEAPGIPASCFFQTEAELGQGGGLDLFFGSATEPGKYFRMNTGNSDNDKAIEFKLVTRPYMFGQPMIKKLYKSAKIWLEAQDTSYGFEFSAIFNLNGSPVITVPYSVPGGGTKWNATGASTTIWLNSEDEQAKYTDFRDFMLSLDPTDDRFDLVTPAAPPVVELTWAGSLLNEYKYSMHRKAEMMQLIFTQNSKDAPITLLGWGVSGSIFSGI